MWIHNINWDMIHDQENYSLIIYQNSYDIYIWIFQRIQAAEFMIWTAEFMIWNHIWIWYESIYMIPYHEFIYKFSAMKNIMKSWLNSLILNWSGFSFKSVSVREQISLIQSNNDPFFAVSLLPAVRLLCCCCSMATGRRCCDSTCRVLLRTTEWGGLEGLFKHMTDVTGVDSDLPGLLQVFSNVASFASSWSLKSQTSLSTLTLSLHRCRPYR